MGCNHSYAELFTRFRVEHFFTDSPDNPHYGDIWLADVRLQRNRSSFAGHSVASGGSFNACPSIRSRRRWCLGYHPRLDHDYHAAASLLCRERLESADGDYHSSITTKQRFRGHRSSRSKCATNRRCSFQQSDGQHYNDVYDYHILFHIRDEW